MAEQITEFKISVGHDNLTREELEMLVNNIDFALDQAMANSILSENLGEDDSGDPKGIDFISVDCIISTVEG